jgi:murein DD-endopeptidase MepM/ murein hydrolase activator NlpD
MSSKNRPSQGISESEAALLQRLLKDYREGHLNERILEKAIHAIAHHHARRFGDELKEWLILALLLIGVFLMGKFVLPQTGFLKPEAATTIATKSSRNRLGTINIQPPSDAPITSPYGWRIHPKLGYQRLHTGIDFGASFGSTVKAADGGVVAFSGWKGGYGNAVIINHGQGISTLYGHSSQLLVQAGQRVKQGDAIALVGSTGLSTGPHIHFEVRENGISVDPAPYLEGRK